MFIVSIEIKLLTVLNHGKWKGTVTKKWFSQWSHGVITIFGWFSESWENLQAQLMPSDFRYLASFWPKNGPKVKRHFFPKKPKNREFWHFLQILWYLKIFSWVRNMRYRPNICFIPFLWSNISFFEVLNSQSKSVNPQFPIKL